MEKKKQEERVKQQQQQQFQNQNTAPNLQSSFSNPFANLNNNPFALLQANQQGSTPSLPNQFGFRPEQLQQLALLQVGRLAKRAQFFVFVEYIFETRPHFRVSFLQYLQSFGGLAGLPNLAGNANPLAANPLFGGNSGNGNGGVIVTSKPVVKVGWFGGSFNVQVGATRTRATTPGVQ